MMRATLEIRLGKYLEGVEGAVLGQVVGFDDSGRRRPSSDHRDIVVPAGNDSSIASSLTLAVDPGRYVVEAMLPSGETTSTQVEAPPASRVEVVLRVMDSPREWLSWQHLMGNVHSSSGPSPRWVERFSPSSVPPPRVLWFDAPPPGLAGFGSFDSSEDPWPLLAEAIRSADPLRALRLGDGRLLEPTVVEADGALLRLGGGGALGWETVDSHPGMHVPRRYVVGHTDGVVELAAVPVPWLTAHGPAAVIDTLVRSTRIPGEAILAMSPMEPDAGPVLGFMAGGSHLAARQLLHRANAMLYGKVNNPLAAAAGGYVLLATAEAHDDEEWRSWIANLSEWYSWLPDGAIQLGRLLLRHRKGREDIDAARAAFFEGYRRGLPFYSLGLQWLVDGLSLLATIDKEAASMLRHVREVAWRANLRELFTTIRLAGE
jgi:hypothetical protein